MKRYLPFVCKKKWFISRLKKIWLWKSNVNPILTLDPPSCLNFVTLAKICEIFFPKKFLCLKVINAINVHLTKQDSVYGMQNKAHLSELKGCSNMGSIVITLVCSLRFSFEYPRENTLVFLKLCMKLRVNEETKVRQPKFYKKNLYRWIKEVGEVKLHLRLIFT